MSGKGGLHLRPSFFFNPNPSSRPPPGGPPMFSDCSLQLTHFPPPLPIILSSLCYVQSAVGVGGRWEGGSFTRHHCTVGTLVSRWGGGHCFLDYTGWQLVTSWG